MYYYYYYTYNIAKNTTKHNKIIKISMLKYKWGKTTGLLLFKAYNNVSVVFENLSVLFVFKYV